MTFSKLLYHRKHKRRGVGGQKKRPNFVNVVCERPLFLFFTALSNLYVALYHGCHLETRCRVVKVKKDLHQGVWKVTAEKRAIKGHIGVESILKACIKGQ